jgi:hypothetical protein
MGSRVASMRHLTDADISSAGWNISTNLQPDYYMQRAGAGPPPIGHMPHPRESSAALTLTTMGAGDASLHLGWTMHRAGINGGDKPRCGFAVSFFADGVRFSSDVLFMGSVSDTSTTVKGVEFQVPSAQPSAELHVARKGALSLSAAWIAPTHSCGAVTRCLWVAQMEDGTRIVAQLLSDDIGTWVPWLLAREMMPGAKARPTAAPLLSWQ